MKIVYQLEGGLITWECSSELKGLDGTKILLKASGAVPNTLKSLGENAIRGYVQKTAAKLIEEYETKELAFIERQKNPNYTVSTMYDGVKLTGKITYASHRKLTVKLTSPYKGSRDMYFGWASAMGGHHIWTPEHELSEVALNTAVGLLIAIYQIKHAGRHNLDDTNLVDSLNR